MAAPGASPPCSAEFVELADRLGGVSCDADPVVALRAPWQLDGWTLPVVELLIVAGAVLALAHAITRHRRGEPAWLALWTGTVVYVLAIEPPLYFPGSFGLEDQTGLIFAHNVFTVDLLYDRLPLYIVALYPAGIYLAHALVERIGVFRAHGAAVGAVTVGVVHHLLYEIFDQLGPQLRWWAWNPDAPSNDPMFASVPLTSVVLFATTSPALITYLGRRLLFTGSTAGGDVSGATGDEERSRAGWVWRTGVVGLATVVLQPVVGLPATVLGALDGDDTIVEAFVLWGIVAVMAAVACYAVPTSAPGAPTGSTPPNRLDRYPVYFGAVYLAVFAVLWGSALPALLDATGGLTADGAPTGNPLYALACGLVVLALIVRAARPRGDAATHVPGQEGVEDVPPRLAEER